ncbi:MAG: hypothetical protein M5R36_21460 [Deltaproteobacteria bacterium]|nr:hypothetical protein [Deltaproteobacteria bacterium]
MLGDKLHFVLNLGLEQDKRFRDKYFPDQPAYVLWWTEDGPRLVRLEDYDEEYLTRNYPEVR